MLRLHTLEWVRLGCHPFVWYTSDQSSAKTRRRRSWCHPYVVWKRHKLFLFACCRPLSLPCPHITIDRIRGAVITLIADDCIETSYWTLRNPTSPEQTPNFLRDILRTNSMVLLFDRSLPGRLLRTGSGIQSSHDTDVSGGNLSFSSRHLSDACSGMPEGPPNFNPDARSRPLSL